MKNKFYLILIFYSIFFSAFVFANEIQFEAENIETLDENTIIANDNIIVTDGLDIEIYGKKLIIDKSKKILTLTGNVIYENKKDLFKIYTNKLTFNQLSQIISTQDETKIIQNDKYNITGKNFFYDKKNKIISSNQDTEMSDNFGNLLKLSNFEISLDKNLFKANNVTLVSKNKNIYQIKKLFYDFRKGEILGKDVIVNEKNDISSKEYLPRAKGKVLISKDGIISLKKSVYTNCKEREGCPPWSLQADEISHDEKKKIVNYKNALLKIYDVPVLYFPKFFHPDPTVERQSGFLVPTIESKKNDSFITTPYFFAISNNSDFTLSPRFYSNQKNLYQGEYRYVTKNSKHTVDASIKNDNPFLSKNKTSKTHFFLDSVLETNIDLFDFSKIDLKLQKVSSDRYLKTFNIKSPIINSQETLKSLVSFEGNNDNLDFSLSSEVYNDLNKTKESDKYEFILPNFTISKNFETNLNGTLSMSNTGYNKLYQTNINEKILINNLIYESMDSINTLGLINNFEIQIKNFNSDSKNSTNYKNNTENNIQGLFQFNSSYPLKKNGNKYDSTITPIFNLKVNPDPNKNIKNFSSLVDYTNIYSIDRIGSNDTLEGGESITIGNEFKILNKQNDDEIFGFNLATSFRKDKNEDLSIMSSLGQKTSNIVGEMNLKTNEFIEFNYDFIADNNIGDFNYHKIKSNFKVNNFVTSFEFVEENNLIGNESFLANETSYNIDNNQDLIFRTRKNKKTDLTEYYDLIYQYKMDCLVAGIKYNKKYYDAGGLKPEENIIFSITFMPFKNRVNLPGIEK